MDDWREQAEEFFGCLAWGINPDDLTCDQCGRIDSALGGDSDKTVNGLCVFCDPPAGGLTEEGKPAKPSRRRDPRPVIQYSLFDF